VLTARYGLSLTKANYVSSFTMVVSARLGLRQVQRKNTNSHFFKFPITKYCLSAVEQLQRITVMNYTARLPRLLKPSIRNDIYRESNDLNLVSE
jgi:hypothetical protein